MFMDLSLAFDTLNHNLLLAKLNAYGFSFSAMKVVQSYLSRRFPRVNLNSNSSKWCKILLVVPQRSYLGPLLFNIFINDVFLFFFPAYTIYTFPNKKFTTTRYFYIWTYLGSQSKCHYKVVDRTTECMKFRGDLCKLFDWETLINNQKG